MEGQAGLCGTRMSPSSSVSLSLSSFYLKGKLLGGEEYQNTIAPALQVTRRMQLLNSEI